MVCIRGTPGLWFVQMTVVFKSQSSVYTGASVDVIVGAGIISGSWVKNSTLPRHEHTTNESSLLRERWTGHSSWHSLDEVGSTWLVGGFSEFAQGVIRVHNSVEVTPGQRAVFDPVPVLPEILGDFDFPFVSWFHQVGCYLLNLDMSHLHWYCDGGFTC